MKTPNIPVEIYNLIQAADNFYLAVHAATYFSASTPEMDHLKSVMDELRKAIIHARNATTVDVNPSGQAGNSCK